MNVSVDYTTVDNKVAKIEKSGRLHATSAGNTVGAKCFESTLSFQYLNKKSGTKIWL